ncbi:MAG: dTDP-4-dehydrorhamnose reductase [bacterium]|nr:dTDP-4-dehydrorhamnose reductase [bacterium]
MKVLILGSRGNLGPEMVEVFSDEKPTAFDKDELDITDEESVMGVITRLKPELVINCAAYNLVDKAEGEGRQIAEDINGTAVGFLAKACNKAGATLVHFSSNYVFDGKKTEGYNEDDTPKPVSVYGRSKLIGEIELQKNTEKYYLVRTAWLYGKQGKSEKSKKNFVDTMLAFAENGQKIECVEDQFGQPTFTKDLAQTVKALVKEQKPYGIYHLTNAGEASWHSWAAEIFKIKSLKPDLTPTSFADFERPAKRPQYGILNNTKYLELRPWTEALKEYLK